MLTTLSNRASALLADPLQAVLREFDQAAGWQSQVMEWNRVAPLTMWEDDAAFYIEMDAPGVAPSDLDVAVENGKLLVTGRRKASERTGGPLREERWFGQFERTIALHEWVDPGSIEASLRDGVLFLKLSKRPEARRQRIAIRYSDSNGTPRLESQSNG